MRLMKESGTPMFFSENTNIIEIRKQNEKTLSSFPCEQGVNFISDKYDGVEIEFAVPKNLSGDNIIYYIHGGGLIIGNTLTSRPFASLLAAESGLKVCSISYRLAPEHKFPAALDDCFVVYKKLIENFPNSKVALVGESGGGYLSLVVTLRAKDESIKLPSCVIVYSPVTDITGNIKTRKDYAPYDLVIANKNIDEFLRKIYCPESNPYDPYISPIYGNYDGFPPLKIVVDKQEVLYDDSRLLSIKAKKSGVEVDYQEWEDTIHSFPTLGKLTPESYQVVRESIEFIKKYL